MDRPSLARAIVDKAYLTGSFKLRSGQTSSFYFDKYQFQADPALLRALGEEMAKLLPPGTEVVAGLELGGVPLAAALSLATGLPAVFVRKERKDYGTERIAEGVALAGRKVTVIEDVITTGGQVIASVKDLRAEGAEVADVICVILRNPEAIAKLGAAGLSLSPVFRIDELPIPKS